MASPQRPRTGGRPRLEENPAFHTTMRAAERLLAQDPTLGNGQLAATLGVRTRRGRPDRRMMARWRQRWAELHQTTQ
jgi:hypothetical protein